MKNQEICNTLQKYVNNKIPNITNEETNRKLLSGFPHTEKWHTLNLGLFPEIEPDTYVEFWYPTVPYNSQTQIPIKHNFIQK